VGNFFVGGVVGQGLAEVVPVAVEVDVFVRRSPPPRKPPGVERVHVQHRDAGCSRGGVESGVAYQGGLQAGPAETFDAMAGACDDQQPRCVGRPKARDVHRQRFAVLAEQRVTVRLQRQPCCLRGAHELAAGFGVGLRERLLHA
jgi:hypothetical protein